MRTSPCLVHPLQFFVAWQGVITLAYSGFPPSLAALKKGLAEAHPGLGPENPGSRWPKTSLGALKEGKRLSLDNLRTLKKLCSAASSHLVGQPIKVEHLSAVTYECRSLEKLLTEQQLPLSGRTDESTPSQEELDSTQAVLNEFREEGLDDYWYHVSKDGSRESHYRGKAVGATLVHFLDHVPEAVMAFQESVDAALPGMYTWFDHSSLHMTVRALA